MITNHFVRLLALCLTSVIASSGQSFTWKNVNIQGMGFVNGSVAHNLAPYDIYIRTDAGGAYRLDRAASRWIPLLDAFGTDFAGQNVDSIAVDPTDPATVYMGVPNYTARTGSQAAEIIASHNRGLSWTPLNLGPLNLTFGGNAPFNGVTGERLAVDPKQPSRLFYGTQTDGLWVYNALNWTKLAGGLPPSTTAPGVVFVTFDPKSSTVYAGIYGSGVWRSTDNGVSWSLINATTNPLRGKLTSDGTLFVTFGGDENARSDGSVQRFRLDAWSTVTPAGVNDSFSGLTVDPLDSRTLVVALNHDMNIWRSVDQGDRWVQLTVTGASNQPSYYPTATTGTNIAKSAGWGNASFLIDPAKTTRLLGTNGMGVLISDDITINTPLWYWQMDNLEELVVQNVKVPPLVVVPGTGEPGADLLSVSMDMIGFRHTSRDAVPTATIGAFEWVAQANSLSYSAQRPEYTAFVGWDQPTYAPKTGFTSDNGKTWKPFGDMSPGRAGNVAMSASNPMNLVWAPVRADVVYSQDGGNTWKPSLFGGAPLPRSWNVVSEWWAPQILIPDLVQGGTFYYYANGDFYSSVDGGATWSKKTTIVTAGTAPILYTIKVTVVANPAKAGDLWIAFMPNSNQTSYFKLLHSSDGGATFTTVDSLAVGNFVAFGKGNSATVPFIYAHGRLVSTDPEAIYKSEDMGATWVRISDPNVERFPSINALEGDMRVSNLVYVGMGGRGIIYGSAPATGTPTPIGISVTPGAVTLKAAQTQQFTATVTGTSNTSVGWNLNPQLGSVTAAGLYTAPSTVNYTQQVLLTALSNADGTTKAIAAITLSPGGQISVTGTAAFVKRDSTTQGNWRSAYGREGYTLAGDQTSNPPYVTPGIGAPTYVWNSFTGDARALQKPLNPSDRVAGTWYSSAPFSINLAFTDTATHQIAIYLLDWDSIYRRQTVEIFDSNGSLLDTQELTTSFNGGVYLVWNVTGQIKVRISPTAGYNGVISGLFFGGAPAGGAATAAFVKLDTITQGNWKANYGLDGSMIMGDSSPNPVYVAPVSSGDTYVWASSTTDVRGLQKASSADRVAGTWYSNSSFIIDLPFTDTALHQVALYCLDWDSTQRRQLVEVVDSNGTLLASQMLNTTFSGGVYVVWNISGRVKFRFTVTAGANAVVSGIFFGGVASTTAASTAAFVKADTTTQGSWKNVYGTGGYMIAGEQSSNPPAYAKTTIAPNSLWTWASSTTAIRALQKSATPDDRIAATWFNTAPFLIDIPTNDTAPHQIALYCLDWDSNERRQRVEVLDANDNVLNTQDLSLFNPGVYLIWNVTGHVKLRITWLGGYQNAVVSGLFFGQ